MDSNYHIGESEINQEQVWVENAKKSPEKFDRLYDKYFEEIFNFIYRRTDDEAAAGDLTSQTFLAALQNLKKYEFRGVPFSAWLYRIAANQVNQYYRKSKKNVVFSLEESMVGKLLHEADASDDDDEKVTLLIGFLAALPTDDMTVLELRFFEEKNFKEIAYILSLTESGAKMRTYRAIEKLKKLFISKGKMID